MVLIRKNIKGWDELLTHIEFAYNRTPGKAIKMSPFQIIYGQNPFNLLDLVPLSTNTKFSWEANKRAEEIKKLHSEVRTRIERSNELAEN